MKKSPDEADLLKNLGPSKFSAEGFLGSDGRPIDEIVSEDLRVLERHHVSKEVLVEALANAYHMAKRALGAEVSLQSGVTAVFHDSMGRIPSPFRGEGVFEKGEAVVKDVEAGDCIIITRLGIHLIERHGFFQGKGSPYRIDPMAAIRTFRLGSEV